MKKIKNMLIHCKLESLDAVKQLGLTYVARKNEVQVIVEHIIDKTEQELCEHYGLNYSTQVNSVEDFLQGAHRAVRI